MNSTIASNELNLGVKALEAANFEARLVQAKIWKFVGLLALTVPFMAMVNYFGSFPWMIGNLFFLFTAVFFFTYVGLKPAFVSIAAVIGAVVADLADKDRSQGALEGIKKLQLIIFVTLVIYADIVMLLSVVPFQHAIWVLPIILAGALIVGMAGIQLGTGKTLFTWSYRINLLLMIAGVLIAILMAFNSNSTDRSSAVATVVNTLPATVTVPHCSTGWSETIAVTQRLEWPEDWPTRHRMVNNGKLVEAGNGHFKTDSIQFCVTNPAMAGMNLPLIWK